MIGTVIPGPAQALVLTDGVFCNGLYMSISMYLYMYIFTTCIISIPSGKLT